MFLKGRLLKIVVSPTIVMLTKLYVMNKLINLSKCVSPHTISGECILRFTTTDRNRSGDRSGKQRTHMNLSDQHRKQK